MFSGDGVKMKELFKNEKGLALPLVMVALAVLTLLGTALWFYSVNDVRQVARAEDKTRAYYVARAGAETLARHIRLNPSVVEEILDVAEENISDIIALETDHLGKAGDLEVSLKRLEDGKLEVTGIGLTNGITQTVSIVLELREFPAPDAVVIATGPQHVDFHQNMTVEGSVVSGGPITLPNSFDDEQYTSTPDFQFPEDYFKRVVVPEDPDEYYESKTIGNNNVFEILNGSHVEVKKLTVNNGGTVHFYAEEDSTTILVVSELDLKNGSAITITGPGTVQIYIRETAKMHSPLITFPGGAQLHFYLAEGSEVSLNGNVNFNGLFYGPYETSVEMQSNTSVTGAMIVESFSGMGGDNQIGAAGTALTYYAGFGDLEFMPIVNMLYWKP